MPGMMLAHELPHQEEFDLQPDAFHKGMHLLLWHPVQYTPFNGSSGM